MAVFFLCCPDMKMSGLFLLVAFREMDSIFKMESILPIG